EASGGQNVRDVGRFCEALRSTLLRSVANRGPVHRSGLPLRVRSQRSTMGAHGSLNVSATAVFVTFPARMFTPSASPAFSRTARSYPFLASCNTYGSVTFVSAYVLVRPTAPGMFVTQ